MDTAVDTVIDSPCVNICELNQQDVCIGCGRKLDEIGSWLAASTSEKLQILEAANCRLAAISGLKA